jgi:hypothetical protein
MGWDSYRKLVRSGGIAACWLMGLGVGWAQSPVPTSPYGGAPRPAQVPTSDMRPVQDAPPAPPAAESLPGPAALPPAAADPSAPCCDGSGVADFWKRVPPVRSVPRPGDFPILPSGCGYYSLVDLLLGREREAPPKYPYAPICPMINSFYDADFRYLDDPNNTQHDYADFLHRIHIGDNFMFDTGGEFRNRYMHEVNSRLTGVTNNYDLIRTRVYGDLWYRDWFRVFVEGIFANSFGQKLPPAAIDINVADIQNAFFDVRIPFTDINEHPAYLRVGRQEMLEGSQRLVSPLDWANTRRTFEGVRAYRTGEKFDTDFFWLRPVIVGPYTFDKDDVHQNFAGGWLTYRPEKGTYIDAYYMYLNNTNKVTQQGIVRAPFEVSTFGWRYAGNRGPVLWDAEGGIQFGDRGPEPIFAGFGTLGAGYNFHELPMNPTIWGYFDYASGDPDPNRNTFRTFNQLFPFGHYYFGFIDLVGRQNIQDFNAHLFLYPTKWVMFWAQYHHFQLDSRTDALYNSGGVAIKRSANGTAGNTIGDELDYVLNFHLGAHTDVFAGYSILFPGNFLLHTSPKFAPELGYVQISYRW